MKVLFGATRCVILLGDKAFKFPLLHSWKSFLNGLLANCTEHEFSKLGNPLLAPILFRLPGGFLNVMPRCTPIWDPEQLEIWWFEAEKYEDVALTELVEYKLDSIGMRGKRLYAIDYG